MTTPLAHSSSSSARLMVNAPGFAVGWQEPVAVVAPGAGAQWAHKVDGRYFTRLLAITFTLVTSVPAGGTVVASSTLNVFLATGAPAYAFGASGGTFGFMPDILVPPDWTWSSAVSGLDAGDVLSGIVLLLQRFPNDAAMIPAG